MQSVKLLISFLERKSLASASACAMWYGSMELFFMKNVQLPTLMKLTPGDENTTIWKKQKTAKRQFNLMSKPCYFHRKMTS